MRQKIDRLVNYFSPSDYIVDLKIDDKKMTFEGKTIITGYKKGAPNKRLVFHQKNLNVKSVKVSYFSKSGPVSLKVSRINKQKSFDQLRIHFDQLIYPGKYEIDIIYSGSISKQMEGIYPCFYKEKGKDKKLIATQFESHHARDVFPCIDEPEAKAVFNLKLNTRDTVVVSNTPISKQKLVNKRLVSEFEPTPKMSTYLLAFVMGDMKFLESKTKNGVIARTYATPANVKLTEFALDVAVKTLDFYTEYYGVDFPLPKCDFIALPDFASGAMENWGCITFREQAMLLDPAHSSLSMKEYVAEVVAHEIAHQWFGNLVTMKWWNDLWLNESFASYMSYMAVDHLFPEWQVWTQFIFEEQEKAMVFDGLNHTHPIEVKINHPDEIRTIFDSISYEKGASVILTLSSYIGSDAFQRGINLYLKKHAYSNTVTTDLWKALEEASKKDVSEFMHSWVSLSGYPIVKIGFVDQNVKLSQSRFYINPAAKRSEEIWPIPLAVEGEKDIRLFYRKSVLLGKDLIPKDRLINPERQGFYRVVYSDKYLSDVLKVSFKKLGIIDRLALLSDHVEAAKGGYTTTLLPLKMLSSYKEESELVVWDEIASFFGSMRLTMRDEELREIIKPYIRSYIKLQLDRLGLTEKKSDSHFDKLLRPIILGLASLSEEPKVIKYINKVFKSDTIPPDYKSLVYSTIARNGTKKEYELLKNKYEESASPEEKLNLTAALCSFKQEDLIMKSLKYMTSDQVKLQDVAYWLAYSFYNYYGRDLAWAWFKKNWDWLDENFKNDLSFFRTPTLIARCYSDKSFAKEFSKFFKERTSPALERSINQGIETIEWQSAWRDRDLKTIKRFFSQFKA